MANNVTLPVTGTGTADVVAASDDVAGVQYPFVKIVSGVEGETTPLGISPTGEILVAESGDVARQTELLVLLAEQNAIMALSGGQWTSVRLREWELRQQWRREAEEERQRAMKPRRRPKLADATMPAFAYEPDILPSDQPWSPDDQTDADDLLMILALIET